MAEKIINVDGVNTPKTNLGKQKMEIIISAAVELFTKEDFIRPLFPIFVKRLKPLLERFTYILTARRIYTAI